MKIRVFLSDLFDRFNRDQTTTLAASLAYYTALSLAPLLILFVTISSHLSDRIQGHFVSEVRDLMGTEAAKTIETIIEHAKDRSDLSSWAGFFGFLTLAVSASLIFGEMRSALNQIFEVRLPESPKTTFFQDIVSFLKARIFHVGLALSFIFTLIVSLIASSVISSNLMTDQHLFASLINIFVSAISYVGLFTLLFHYLPDRRLPWNKAIKGAALTSLLFLIGKELIGIYLGNSAVGSAYGAAGSVIVLLVWVYYSALITFIGAQVSSLLEKNGESSS